jgi:hypothetical protein
MIFLFTTVAHSTPVISSETCNVKGVEQKIDERTLSYALSSLPLHALGAARDLAPQPLSQVVEKVNAFISSIHDPQEKAAAIEHVKELLIDRGRDGRSVRERYLLERAMLQDDDQYEELSLSSSIDNVAISSVHDLFYILKYAPDQNAQMDALTQLLIHVRRGEKLKGYDFSALFIDVIQKNFFSLDSRAKKFIADWEAADEKFYYFKEGRTYAEEIAYVKYGLDLEMSNVREVIYAILLTLAHRKETAFFNVPMRYFLAIAVTFEALTSHDSRNRSYIMLAALIDRLTHNIEEREIVPTIESLKNDTKPISKSSGKQAGFARVMALVSLLIFSTPFLYAYNVFFLEDSRVISRTPALSETEYSDKREIKNDALKVAYIKHSGARSSISTKEKKQKTFYLLFLLPLFFIVSLIFEKNEQQTDIQKVANADVPRDQAPRKSRIQTKIKNIQTILKAGVHGIFSSIRSARRERLLTQLPKNFYSLREASRTAQNAADELMRLYPHDENVIERVYLSGLNTDEARQLLFSMGAKSSFSKVFSYGSGYSHELKENAARALLYLAADDAEVISKIFFAGIETEKSYEILNGLGAYEKIIQGMKSMDRTVQDYAARFYLKMFLVNYELGKIAAQGENLIAENFLLEKRRNNYHFNLSMTRPDLYSFVTLFAIMKFEEKISVDISPMLNTCTQFVDMFNQGERTFLSQRKQRKTAADIMNGAKNKDISFDSFDDEMLSLVSQLPKNSNYAQRAARIALDIIERNFTHELLHDISNEVVSMQTLAASGQIDTKLDNTSAQVKTNLLEKFIPWLALFFVLVYPASSFAGDFATRVSQLLPSLPVSLMSVAGATVALLSFIAIVFFFAETFIDIFRTSKIRTVSTLKEPRVSVTPLAAKTKNSLFISRTRKRVENIMRTSKPVTKRIAKKVRGHEAFVEPNPVVAHASMDEDRLRLERRTYYPPNSVAKRAKSTTRIDRPHTISYYGDEFHTNVASETSVTKEEKQRITQVSDQSEVLKSPTVRSYYTPEKEVKKAKNLNVQNEVRVTTHYGGDDTSEVPRKGMKKHTIRAPQISQENVTRVREPFVARTIHRYGAIIFAVFLAAGFTLGGAEWAQAATDTIGIKEVGLSTLFTGALFAGIWGALYAIEWGWKALKGLKFLYHMKVARKVMQTSDQFIALDSPLFERVRRELQKAERLHISDSQVFKLYQDLYARVGDETQVMVYYAMRISKTGIQDGAGKSDLYFEQALFAVQSQSEDIRERAYDLTGEALRWGQYKAHARLRAAKIYIALSDMYSARRELTYIVNHNKKNKAQYKEALTILNEIENQDKAADANQESKNRVLRSFLLGGSISLLALLSRSVAEASMGTHHPDFYAAAHSVKDLFLSCAPLGAFLFMVDKGLNLLIRNRVASEKKEPVHKWQGWVLILGSVILAGYLFVMTVIYTSLKVIGTTYTLYARIKERGAALLKNMGVKTHVNSLYIQVGDESAFVDAPHVAKETDLKPQKSIRSFLWSKIRIILKLDLLKSIVLFSIFGFFTMLPSAAQAFSLRQSILFVSYLNWIDYTVIVMAVVAGVIAIVKGIDQIFSHEKRKSTMVSQSDVQVSPKEIVPVSEEKGNTGDTPEAGLLPLLQSSIFESEPALISSPNLLLVRNKLNRSVRSVTNQLKEEYALSLRKNVFFEINPALNVLAQFQASHTKSAKNFIYVAPSIVDNQIVLEGEIVHELVHYILEKMDLPQDIADTYRTHEHRKHETIERLEYSAHLQDVIATVIELRYIYQRSYAVDQEKGLRLGTTLNASLAFLNSSESSLTDQSKLHLKNMLNHWRRVEGAPLSRHIEVVRSLLSFKKYVTETPEKLTERDIEKLDNLIWELEDEIFIGGSFDGAIEEINESILKGSENDIVCAAQSSRNEPRAVLIDNIELKTIDLEVLRTLVTDKNPLFIRDEKVVYQATITKELRVEKTFFDPFYVSDLAGAVNYVATKGYQVSVVSRSSEKSQFEELYGRGDVLLFSTAYAFREVGEKIPDIFSLEAMVFPYAFTMNTDELHDYAGVNRLFYTQGKVFALNPDYVSHFGDTIEQSLARIMDSIRAAVSQIALDRAIQIAA